MNTTYGMPKKGPSRVFKKFKELPPGTESGLDYRVLATVQLTYAQVKMLQEFTQGTPSYATDKDTFTLDSLADMYANRFQELIDSKGFPRKSNKSLPDAYVIKGNVGGKHQKALTEVVFLEATARREYRPQQVLVPATYAA